MISHFISWLSQWLMIQGSLRADSDWAQLRPRNSAEILVLDIQLCTQIWVRATIGQLKKAFVLFVVIANQVEGEFETHFR